MALENRGTNNEIISGDSTFQQEIPVHSTLYDAPDPSTMAVK